MSTPAPAPSPDVNPDEVREIIAPLLSLEGAALPILHALQDAYGCVPDGARPIVAEALNITQAELYGVISFYHDFRSAPAEGRVIKICRAEACQAMGGAAMALRVLDRLGIDWHGTASDGSVTVEPVYCLGLCANGPAAMVGDKLVARATEDTLLEAARA